MNWVAQASSACAAQGRSWVRRSTVLKAALAAASAYWLYCDSEIGVKELPGKEPASSSSLKCADSPRSTPRRSLIELSYWIRVRRRIGENPIWSSLQADGPVTVEVPPVPPVPPGGASPGRPLPVSIAPTHPTSDAASI